MQTIYDAIERMTWQDWATFGSILFGIITLIAYIEQRRSSKSQSAIIEFVSRHVDKDISEETIQQLLVQREEMQRQVDENIPALARAAVLREQAEVHASVISKHFIDWQSIQQELQESPSRGSIDPVVEKIIVDRLVPQYEKQASLDKVRNRITVLSVAAALIGTVLPSPLNSLAAVIVAIPLINNLINLYKLTVEPKEFQVTLSRIVFLICIFLLVASIFFGILLFTVGNVSDIGKLLRIILLIFGTAGTLLILVFWNRIKTKLSLDPSS